MMFANRTEAGRQLAAALGKYRSAEPIVLALPRGGVPVGYEVAGALGAPLQVFAVRKLGAPGHAELAIGAVAPGGVTVLDRELIRFLGVPESYLAQVMAREQAELKRRLELFGAEGPALSLAGRTVILVDDGIATGATMLAAVDAVRKQGAEHIIVAAPVAAPEAVVRLESTADEVVCLETPGDFGAVGYWYQDFAQTSDDEVRDLLKRSRPARAPQAPVH